MKLNERKYTTYKGLEAFEELLNSFEFESDVGTVLSKSFYARFELSSGQYGSYNYHEYTHEKGHFRIKNGHLEMILSDGEYGGNNEVVNITDCNQLNFQAAITALNEVIDEYNKKCSEKDAQIEKFLNVIAKLRG